MFISVVLPAPFSPSSASTSPRAQLERDARRWRPAAPKRLVMPARRRTGVSRFRRRRRVCTPLMPASHAGFTRTCGSASSTSAHASNLPPDLIARLLLGLHLASTSSAGHLAPRSVPSGASSQPPVLHDRVRAVVLGLEACRPSPPSSARSIVGSMCHSARGDDRVRDTRPGCRSRCRSRACPSPWRRRRRRSARRTARRRPCRSSRTPLPWPWADRTSEPMKVTGNLTFGLTSFAPGHEGVHQPVDLGDRDSRRPCRSCSTWSCRRRSCRSGRPAPGCSCRRPRSWAPAACPS